MSNCENYELVLHFRHSADFQEPEAFSVFIPEFLNENEYFSPSFFRPPLAQSELLEMSQPISSGIQREQSHYRLMRRQGIEGFILMTVMRVCKRAVCTCFSFFLNIFFFVPAVGLEPPEREINLWVHIHISDDYY